jgi:hypothetical protein
LHWKKAEIGINSLSVAIFTIVLERGGITRPYFFEDEKETEEAKESFEHTISYLYMICRCLYIITKRQPHTDTHIQITTQL